MRRLVLTGEEKKVILFVLVALLVGLAVKLYRANKQQPPPSKTAPAALLAATIAFVSAKGPTSTLARRGETS